VVLISMAGDGLPRFGAIRRLKVLFIRVDIALVLLLGSRGVGAEVLCC
jgi:hypothetical protein